MTRLSRIDSSNSFTSKNDEPWSRWQNSSEHRRKLLRAVVDLGIISILFIAPLAMGGRHPAGKWLLTSIIWTTVISWLLHQLHDSRSRWEFSGAEVILVLALALVSLQIVPAPALQPFLSPAQNDLLPMWQVPSVQGEAFLGLWQTPSLSPESTRRGLVLLASYAVLFIVTFQRLQTIDDVDRLLKWIAMAVVLMAVIGLLQYLAGNGRFLWIYEHPSRSPAHTVKGTFANQNHFTHFLALGMVPLIAWLERKIATRTNGLNSFIGKSSDRHTARVSLIGLGIVLVGLAGILSFSRGGLAVMALAILCYVALRTFHRGIEYRTLAGASVVIVILMIALSFHGHQRLADRIDTVTSGSLQSLDPDGARRKIWAAAYEAIPDFERLGAGVGTHSALYPRYLESRLDYTYSHAESGYLQILLETGLPGLFLLVIALTLSAKWIWRGLRSNLGSDNRLRVCSAVLAATWLTTVTHSFIDFVWYIPACLSCVVLMMAAAARLNRLAENRTKSVPVSQFNWILMTGMAITVAFLSHSIQSGPAVASRHWDKYLSMSLDAEREKEKLQEAGKIAGRPLSHIETDQLKIMAAHLESALAADPDDARCHLRLATTYLHLFELAQQASDNPMSLGTLREAAIASGFATTEQLQAWLQAATGDHFQYLEQAWQHASHATRLCPLYGKSYLHLSDLAFVYGCDPSRSALIQQALAVRPHDGAALYTAGYQALQNQDADQATAYFQAAMKGGPNIQAAIVHTVAPQLPPQTFIELFQPNVTGLRELFRYYRATHKDQQARLVGRQYVTALESAAEQETGAAAASHWQEAQAIHGFLQDYDRALLATQKAVAAQPDNYQLNYLLAVRLSHAGEFSRSLDRLNQCRRRRPYDTAVLNKIAEIEAKLTR